MSTVAQCCSPVRLVAAEHRVATLSGLFHCSLVGAADCSRPKECHGQCASHVQGAGGRPPDSCCHRFLPATTMVFRGALAPAATMGSFASLPPSCTSSALREKAGLGGSPCGSMIYKHAAWSARPAEHVASGQNVHRCTLGAGSRAQPPARHSSSTSCVCRQPRLQGTAQGGPHDAADALPRAEMRAGAGQLGGRQLAHGADVGRPAGGSLHKGRRRG